MAPKTKIFVGRLPEGCTSTDLQALFEKYGTVKECDVINKYGFVHMSCPEEADEAIKALNSFNFMGSVISVEPSTSTLHPEPGAPGRAKGPGGPMGAGGGRGGARNGFPTRDIFYNDAYYETPRDMYFDRPQLFGRDRGRPYPMSYDRRGPPLMPPREDLYSRHPVPPPMPPSMMTREDLYERHPLRERPTPEYLYSRRSPPPMTAGTDAYAAASDDWFSHMPRY